jgi:hypothetical protein
MVAIVAVVIVIIPVPLGAPTMAIFVPPPMTVAPAILTRFAQLGARMVRLPALASMMFDRFVKTMVSLGNAVLAIVVGAQTRNAGEEQESRQRRTGQRDFSHPENSRLQFCLHPVLLCFLK